MGMGLDDSNCPDPRVSLEISRLVRDLSTGLFVLAVRPVTHRPVHGNPYHDRFR
jgi:hypothetical protein